MNRRSSYARSAWIGGLMLALTAGVAAASDDGERSGPLLTYPLPLWLDSPPSKAVIGPSFEEEVVEIVNQERWDNGMLAPLKHQALLDSSAETHSSNMAARDFFAHCDPDTLTSADDRMTAAGYTGILSWGENIAAGYSSPTAVMTGWMASPGHRSNILTTSRREIGVGYVLDGSDTNNVRYDLDGNCVVESTGHGPFFHYWTQNFGRRINVYPVVINREAYMTATAYVDLYLYGASWGAVDMRIRNESGPWTAWMPFATDVSWTLTGGAEVKTVTVEIRNGAMQVLSASDSIVSDDTTLIFTDGFESGNLTAWSSVTP